ncbi:GtrA family protein [Oryzobacter terrae]|uniref:GtrA family protein n=1 Tax=Oryzobacter terrae TaxID=1620385 RepID=UPI0036703047
MGDAPGLGVPSPTSVWSARWLRLPMMVRFGVVGGAAQVVYLVALVAALATGIHYLLAVVAAQVVTIAFAFPMHKYLVFRSDGPIRRQFLMFLGVWWTGAAASFLGVLLLVEVVGLDPLPAQLVVMVLIAVWSFVANSRLSFARRHPTVVDQDPNLQEASP